MILPSKFAMTWSTSSSAFSRMAGFRAISYSVKEVVPAELSKPAIVKTNTWAAISSSVSFCLLLASPVEEGEFV